MAVAHWPRRPLPSARPASLLSWTTPPSPPLLEGGRGKRRPGDDLGLFPDMERVDSAELAPSSAWSKPPRAFSLVKTRRPQCACSVFRGRPSASRSGQAVSTLMRKVPGLTLPSGPPMAAMTNGDPWPRRGVAYPRMCSQSSWRAPAGCFPRCAPMAPSVPTHKDHEKDVRAEICRAIGREEGSRRGMFVG
jgi:hypothetical protein